MTTCIGTLHEAGRDDMEKTHEKVGGLFFCFLISQSFRDLSASSPEALLVADAVRGGAIASRGEELLDEEVMFAMELGSSVVWRELISHGCPNTLDEVRSG
jgi:hypothetical protein